MNLVPQIYLNPQRARAPAVFFLFPSTVSNCGDRPRRVQHGSPIRSVAQANAVAVSLVVSQLKLLAALVAHELAVIRQGVEQGSVLLTACHIDAGRLLQASGR